LRWLLIIFQVFTWILMKFSVLFDFVFIVNETGCMFSGS
jgi:hypothetical protein